MVGWRRQRSQSSAEIVGGLGGSDRNSLLLAITEARAHDPTLTEEDAQPVFLADLVHASGRFALFRVLLGQLPEVRGYVDGKPFWLRRDAIRWKAGR